MKTTKKSTYSLGSKWKSDYKILKDGKKTDLSTIDLKNAKKAIATLNKNQPDLSKKKPTPKKVTAKKK